MLREALAQHQQGQLDAAERGCREVLALVDDNAVAWHLLGLLCNARGAGREAVEALRRAVRLAPGDAIVLNNLGNVLRGQGEHAEAARAYRRALELRPDYFNARYNLGKALQAAGKAEAAVDALRALVEMAPGDAGAWDALGSALLDAGRAEEALDVHRHALSLDAELADAHNGLGLAYVDLGRFDEAVECFRHALELDPTFTKAALNLTRAKRFAEVGDADLRCLRTMVERADLPAEENADLRFALGKALDDLGEHGAAFRQFAAANAARGALEHFDAEAHARWCERIREVFDAALFERCAGWGLKDTTPILIVGMPRSGTTLVEQILASHPAVYGGDELGALQALANDLPSRLGGKPYPDCVAKISRSLVRRVGERYVAALRARGGDATRITDKMPANFLHLGLLALALPRARIVHCVRHPLDVAVSIWFHQFTQGHAYSWRLADIGAYYRAYRGLMAHWHAVLPIPVHDLHYEQLVADPEPNVRAMLEACGLAWDPACLDFHRTRRAVHTASAWQVRQPINARAVGRWRAYENELAELRGQLADYLEAF